MDLVGGAALPRLADVAVDPRVLVFAVAVSASLTAVATLAFLIWNRSLRDVDQASRDAVSRNIQTAGGAPAPVEQVSAAS